MVQSGRHKRWDILWGGGVEDSFNNGQLNTVMGDRNNLDSHQHRNCWDSEVLRRLYGDYNDEGYGVSHGGRPCMG
jgi:hypothetical protein